MKSSKIMETHIRCDGRKTGSNNQLTNSPIIGLLFNSILFLLLNEHLIRCVSSQISLVNQESLKGNKYYEDSDSTDDLHIQLTPELEPTAKDMEDGYCVIDPILSCGTGPKGEDIPCKRAQRPQSLNDTVALALLKETCPQFLEENEDPLLCCDHKALQLLVQSYELSKNLGIDRCPSCFHNWRKTFCNFACSARQNKFLNVTKSQLIEDKGLYKVEEVAFYMNEHFSNDFYDSCKGLKGVFAGSYLMDLMCGDWGHKKCNSSRWLKFIGTSVENGGHAPFQINYVFSNEKSLIKNGIAMYPLNLSAISCSESPPGESSCSCSDCENSCKADNPSQLPSEVQSQLPSQSQPISISNLHIIIASSVFIYFAVYSTRI